MDEGATDQDESGEEDGDADPDANPEDSESEGQEQQTGDAVEMDSAEESDEDMEDGMMESEDAPAGEMPEDAEMGDADEASESKRPPMHGLDSRHGPDYKAYTPRFDETIDAEDLCEPEELERLRAYLDKQLSNLSSVVARLANRLQRKLMAQQNRAWEFDLEEGILDPARLPRIIIDPLSGVVFQT